MQRLILVLPSVAAVAAAALMAHGDDVAAAECKLYTVTAPILDVRKDAEKQGGYIDVLEGGEVACVTKEQQVGNKAMGFVAHKVPKEGPIKPINGWVGLRFMKLQAKGEAAAPKAEAAAPRPEPAAPEAEPKQEEAAAVPAPAPAQKPEEEGLKFDQPVPFGPYPVRGKTLQELAQWEPIFSPLEGLDESLWKKSCATCHKWNQERLCKQGASYIKAARLVFRHQHPYGGPYKLALMRWAKSGCN